jgi:hypothetical protein
MYCNDEINDSKLCNICYDVADLNEIVKNNKKFKDCSELYKSSSNNIVDRIYVGIKNQDGYEARKALVRSERLPLIGDMFCRGSK